MEEDDQPEGPQTPGGKCWEITGRVSMMGDTCLTCPAYLEKAHCWEVEHTNCTNSPAICILLKCPVYLQYKDDIEAKLAQEDLEETLERAEAIALKRCWEIRNCPPEARADCPAYQGRGNCWMTATCVCAAKNDAACRMCPIYIYHVLYQQRGLDSMRKTEDGPRRPD